MDREKNTKEQISALADGELDDAQAREVLDRLGDPALRSLWDRYHQLGDVIRSDDMGASMSADFSDRFAARLAAEPPLLVAKRGPAGGLRAWPAALAAVAAAATGFFIAPGIFGDGDAPKGGIVQVARTANAQQDAVLAEASGVNAVARAGVADYIRLHQSANPALYGAASLARPVVLDDSAER